MGVCKELRNEIIAARSGKPAWLTKAYVRTVRGIEHHPVVSSGILAHEFPDKRPRDWTKQALITSEEATEAYMLEVKAELHC